MLLLKTGFPEEGELVICTVTKIFHHSIFVELDEFKKPGLIHISEVSPGRIRNIRDFVREGKKVICVVLKVSPEKGHIDLSLRRVNESQKRKKNDQIKQEQKSEKIVEFVAKNQHKDFNDLYKKIFEKISKNYGTLYECFHDVSSGNVDLEQLGLDKPIAKELTELIKLRMKPPEIFLKGKFMIKIYIPNGVDAIKKALLKGELLYEKSSIKYEGAGKYALVIQDTDYKDAEKKLEKVVSTVTSEIEKKGGHVEFNREETK